MRFHSPIRLAWIVSFTLVAGFMTRPAGAIVVANPWSYFYVTNSTGTQIALVAEQVFPTGTSLGYDYEFRVANIDPNQTPISGFELYVGNQAGLAPQVLAPLGPVPGYTGYSLYFGPPRTPPRHSSAARARRIRRSRGASPRT